MAEQENKSITERLVIDLFNGRKYELAHTLVSGDFRSHNPRVGPGPAGIEGFARNFANGFSDFRGEIVETLAEGDRVIIWVRWRGTHSGTFAGVPATGRQVEFETVELFRFADGKVVEHWDVADRLALQTALGLVKPT